MCCTNGAPSQCDSAVLQLSDPRGLPGGDSKIEGTGTVKGSHFGADLDSAWFEQLPIQKSQLPTPRGRDSFKDTALPIHTSQLRKSFTYSLAHNGYQTEGVTLLSKAHRTRAEYLMISQARRVAKSWETTRSQKT